MAVPLSNIECEIIITNIEKSLTDLYKSKVNAVAVSCRTIDGQVKFIFSDPTYHDLIFTEVIIKNFNNVISIKQSA